MMIRIPKGKDHNPMASSYNKPCLLSLASACVCAPLYTLGQSGNSNESPLSSVSSSSSNPHPNASPHKIQKSSQRNGSVVIPESIARGLRYEADSSRRSPQELSNVSGIESIALTSHELPKSSASEPALLHTYETQTSSPDNVIGLQAQNIISNTQETGRLQLGMMGIGGYRAGKDEIGWSGDWPSLHKPVNGEGLVSTLAQPSTRGCCSSIHGVSQALPVAPSPCCSSHPGLSNRLPPAFSHGVSGGGCLSCHNCGSDIAPSRQYSSPIPNNELGMTYKHQPWVYHQHPTAHCPYHMDTSQTTLYTIPPSYATATHPLTPQQLTYLQQHPHLYAQTVPQHAPFGIVGQVAPPAEAITRLTPAHNCNCGSGCECLGCAAHPFNATTRSHVQSLGAIIAHGEHDSMSNNHPSPSYNLPPSHSFPAHNNAPILPRGYNPNTSSNIPASTLTAHQPAITAGPSSPWSPSPGNGVGEQQIPFLSSEYYTMEIPMDAPGLAASCTDVSGSCQCGDECACIGCLTHTGHNGIALDVPAD